MDKYLTLKARILIKVKSQKSKINIKIFSIFHFNILLKNKYFTTLQKTAKSRFSAIRNYFWGQRSNKITKKLKEGCASQEIKLRVIGHHDTNFQICQIQNCGLCPPK